MCEDGFVGALIDHVDCQPVSGLHQRVQIFSARVNFDPARVVAGVWGLQAVQQLQLAGVCILLVCPDLVGLQVCGVEIGLGGVEDHAVDTGVFVIGVVLDIGLKGTVRLNGEDISISCVFVEWVAIYIVRGLVGG